MNKVIFLSFSLISTRAFRSCRSLKKLQDFLTIFGIDVNGKVSFSKFRKS